MIGVSKSENAVIEVALHFNQLTEKYKVIKSINETQKYKWLDKKTLELKIKVVINYELELLILFYAESIKVIEPQHLQNKIKERLVKGSEQYPLIFWYCKINLFFLLSIAKSELSILQIHS